MAREFKRMEFKMDSYDEGEGIFSGYGAVFENIESGGDIIEQGAFTKTLAEGWERVKILALHSDSCLPIGRPIELREDENGLYISARISDTAMGRDVKILLKDHVLNELSIGYDPVIFDYDENGIRHLREVKLWEVSVVTWAMNPEAVITSYKSVREPAGKPPDTESRISKSIQVGKPAGKKQKALRRSSAAPSERKSYDNNEIEIYF